MTLADALPDLETARDHFVASVDALSEAQRGWRPAPEAWSPADIAEHLMRSERGLLGGLDRQLSAGEGRKELGAPSDLALRQLLDALDGETRHTMPTKAAPYIAPSGAAWADTRAAWGAVARGWRGALGALPSDLEDVGLLMHPRIGPVTAAGAIRFSTAHTHHHQAQLDRTRAHADFPAEPV